MKKIWVTALCAAALGLGGCERQSGQEHSGQEHSGEGVTGSVQPEQAAAQPRSTTVQLNQAALAQFEQDLHRHTAVLSADEFEGRAPATPGGEKTINYLQQEFAALGLEPGNGDSYFQRVPVAEITTDPTAQLRIKAEGYTADLAYGTEMVVFTQQQKERIAIEDSELVFVGYGINAPERDWNDYAGIDVAGKTVVILVNDPGFITQDPAHFTGNAMTYYGRWTYKYEEAARQGAAAALVIHDTAPAAYPWEVVPNSWSGPQIHLQRADKGESKLPVEAWIHLQPATELLRAAGLDYDTLKREAAQPGFKAIPLNAAASFSLQNSIRYVESRNVIAKISGSERADEVVIYMAHWDHLGRDTSLEGDQIYNGAVDNATGTAALLALGRVFKAAPPQRTVMFMAVTAEESGLLGSKFYGENPIYPHNKTVGAINIDAMGSIGPVRDVTVIGHGFNQLQDYLARHAQKQGRYIVPDQNAEKGFYYRSDHFSLAKHGVPALYAEGGHDSVAHGKEWGKQQQDDYTANRYHKPGDEYHEEMDLSGAAQDLELYFYIGSDLANSNDWPGWNAGSEFKLIREKSRAELK
ncbi:M28 family peptidase [Exilibacterium tricleocarpae]|uniref:M28 family peptidase n=1 Tax=Exilibacterium tricleocarpae TaxID=2591008 RepID=A0A545SS16_9GAMM|nr:M28 family metallopeptidase [Exilibacterium tricleocarpae]TQV67706.1 M28 family peptidase [Exilibacterium tricleocarpae]